ncbi:hypothetical protein [Clostridium cylindrosporum]|uniref:Uncharacterized protein n=1 Tax=Clostridium cylindrosporum DSM 605 TaxID=1121307 RepID=A0A0J8D8A4_CLOCY|nr:hypothetical protein [Clostridium cylindrosporum]KMT22097.1 hypothetical protein CLCY_4c00700 [Clostridium cylindrosporum DSM 605]
MISAINPYGVNSNFRAQGNAAGDYLCLDLVIKTCKSMEISVNEFWSSYDPKKFYIGIQGINFNTVGARLNVKA